MQVKMNLFERRNLLDLFNGDSTIRNPNWLPITIKEIGMDSHGMMTCYLIIQKDDHRLRAIERKKFERSHAESIIHWFHGGTLHKEPRNVS